MRPDWCIVASSWPAANFVEILVEGEVDEVGMLKMAMYGTRDAPMAWSREVEQTMTTFGFERGKSEPCCYHHKRRGVSLVVHVDDTAATGNKKELTWLAEELQKEV